MPLLLIDWIEIEGPLKTEADLAKQKDLMPADEKDPTEINACLKAICRTGMASVGEGCGDRPLYEFHRRRAE